MTALTPADVPGQGEVEGLAAFIKGEIPSWDPEWARDLAERIGESDWLASVKADAWDEGHARANGYDLSYHLDREEWEEYADKASNPHRATEPRA